MHQQMLARYDTERIALDLQPTVPFDDYDGLIPEGYFAEAIIANRYNGREANTRIRDLRFVMPPALGGGFLDVADLRESRKQIEDAARLGRFEVPGAAPVVLTPDPAGATILGATIEATVGTVPLPGQVAAVGGLHNLGHGFFSALSPDGGGTSGGGVMGSSTVAVRDPIFYRWHRHIDDLFVGWQERLPANDLGANVPRVVMRKDAQGQSSDIGLALVSDLEAGATNGTLIDGAGIGAARFGGANNWDTPLTSFVGGAGGLTRTLQTRLESYTLTVPSPAGNRTFTINHLDHDEFAYFVRLQNTTGTEQRVTVRIFLAPRARADDRRWWIEMDKFLHVLQPDQKAVVYRPARLSSVARKPARRPSEPVAGPQHPNDDYCNCGWPYHMLLPRGREGGAGMPFRLFVMLTDAVSDLAGVEDHCGSVSFCGSRDQKYPDNRMMGYPFDRPFGARTISQVISDPSFEHIAALDFVIKHG